jgi:putative Mg2+ transporter-C (MgtC) family protein
MDVTEILLRFFITFALSLVFGIERQKSHKPIGFGTFIFVSIGSCGLALTAISLSQENPAENPIPLLGAIVTGIGFLGAGALIKTTDKIFGFTTAASIWLFAIFGLIIGVGNYFIGLVMYSLAWVVVFYDKHLEKKGMGSYQRRVLISTNRIIDEKVARKLIGVSKCKLIHMQLEKKEARMHLSYLVEGGIDEIEQIPGKLMQEEWFDSCKLE